MLLPLDLLCTNINKKSKIFEYLLEQIVLKKCLNSVSYSYPKISHYTIQNKCIDKSNYLQFHVFSAYDAMYLYHTGLEWKFGKVGSLKVGEFVNLLYCTTCGQHYHYTGAQVRITSVIRAGWQCQKCKWCLNCRQSNQDDRYLLCDVCDGAFHAHCLRPQMTTIPKNGWKCKVE